MMSNRCRMVVKEELKKMGLHFIVVELGEVELMETLNTEQRSELKAALLLSGLELMDDKRAVLIAQIKEAVAEMISSNDDQMKINFSDFISSKLGHNYTYLAGLFAEVQGSTIGQYIIAHKVELVKELIMYGELSITEIAWKLNYSSVAHLSNQFKKVTGYAPSHFKQLKELRSNVSPGKVITT